MMTMEQIENGSPIHQRIVEEETVRDKVDEDGTRWTKVYFGGGAHFRNWLSQFVELKGEENVKVEEADSRGFQCYEESGEKMYRIWIRNTTSGEENGSMSTSITSHINKIKTNGGW
jgi:hypothetical protein